MLFQPVVNLSSGNLTGFEALARLSDGDKLIAPLQFLPSFGDAELFNLFEIGLYQVLAPLFDRSLLTILLRDWMSTIGLMHRHL